MKKINHEQFPWGIKLSLKMRLTILLLLISLLRVNASSYSQNTKITLDLEDVSVSTVLREIENLSEFSIYYRDSQIDFSRKVTINVNKLRIKKILDYLFLDSNVTFEVFEKNIILQDLSIEKESSQEDQNEVTLFDLNQQPVVEEQIEITGTVTDESGAPLPGVNIIVIGKTTGTETDFDGKFTISAVEGEVLQFSFIGMETQNITVGKINNIRVILKESAGVLDEIVIVGYGQQKKINLTGSIVTVKAEEFENRNVSNPVQALQGKVAGLRVTQTTGTPGAEDITFQIRGVNSFSSDASISNRAKNQPLVLINGIVGNMNNLDPAFIESVTVLKDAASASIYGARAANGVILVTTKKGALGGTTVSYTGRVMNQRKINQLDRDWNSVNFMEKVNKWSAPWTGRYYSDEVINNFRNNPNSDEFPNFNHEDYYLHDVTVQTHNIQVGGGSEKTRYNIGIGYWDQDGIADGFSFEKTNALINIESQVNDFVKVGAVVNGTLSDRTEPYNGERDYLMGIISQSPTYKPWLLDGSGRFTGSNNGSEPESEGYGDISSKNAFAIASSPSALLYDNNFSVNGNVFFEAKLLKGLTWYTKAGLDINQQDYKQRRPLLRMYSYRSGEFQGNMDNIGSEELQHRIATTKNFTIFSYLDYQKTLNEDHNFGLMLGVSQESNSFEYLEGTRRGFASPNLDVLDGAPADGQTTGGNLNEYVLKSLFGRFKYNFKSKYLFEANFRYDGSSRFHEDNRWGFFPSFSAAWRLSEENFMEGTADWLSDLKIRYSYGTMGNDKIGFYPYQSVLTLGKDYAYGSNLIGGGLREGLANEEIQWEETKIADIGIDLSMWNNKFNMTFDYYDKTTSGILRVAQLPATSGLLPPFVNEGVVNNKGYEIILGHHNRVGDWTYGIDFNWSQYKNKLVEFGTRTFDTNAMIEGEEMNRYYMYQADGIYQSQAEIDNGPTPRWPASPGDIRYKDIDGDGAITPDDRTDVDGVNPDFFYGFEATAGWKGFDFSMFFQGEQGRKVLVNNEWSLVLPFSVHGANPITWWDDSWTPENQSTTKPRAVAYGAPTGETIKQANTYWLREASYLRLKNINLGYTLSSELLDKTFIQGARFFINGENLVTFTNFEFGDPERPGDNLYPIFRTLALGATIKF